MDNTLQTPLVSVVCTTYNHQDYIEEALKGFLMQQTDFPVEIIVHDDASTDNTAEIIRKYEESHPHLFCNIYQSENQYSKGADIWEELFVKKCRGKYIAICEGDDFWTDPLKLQKQVAFLETHPDYGIVYGKAKYYVQSTGRFSQTFGWKTEGLYALLKGNVVPTLTVCFCKGLYVDYLKTIRPQEQKWKMGDYPIWLWIAGNKKAGFMDETQGVYRVLAESASHSADLRKQLEFIESYAAIKRFFATFFSVSDKEVIDSIEEQYLIGLFRTTVLLKGDRALLAATLKNSRVSTFKLSILRLIVSSRCLYKLSAYFLNQ